MKRFAPIFMFVLFASPSFAYHIEWYDQNPSEAQLEQSGMLIYLKFPDTPYFETPYFESPMDGYYASGIFRLDPGDISSFMTGMRFDTLLEITSSVPTENVYGDVFFNCFLVFGIVDLINSNEVYSATYEQILNHSLGTASSPSFIWDHDFLFLPDNEYLFYAHFSFNSIDPTKDDPSKYWLHRQVSALHSDIDEIVEVDISWHGTSSLQFHHTPVPEPDTIILFGCGLITIFLRSRHFRKLTATL